jgi:hypothetical protein
MGPGGRRGANNRWGAADSLGRDDGLAICLMSSGEALLLGRLSDSLRPGWSLSRSLPPYFSLRMSSTRPSLGGEEESVDYQQ